MENTREYNDLIIEPERYPVLTIKIYSDGSCRTEQSRQLSIKEFAVLDCVTKSIDTLNHSLPNGTEVKP